ncbi:MAG TPA: type II toxin-antitoxin system PemK/MazF family toxin [Gammaproteobacteria bacterium]|nr:type II toxin-antitoxin system PemK/MazF family toxin [Gammaproteobacteria bacterium]
MKRGEIYFANLDPTVGSEIRKKRPVLIVSNNANNKASSTVTIVPITSNINKVYPFEVQLETKDCGLSKSSKAQCHQIRTISKIRIVGKGVGLASKEIMLKINAALKLHLDF